LTEVLERNIIKAEKSKRKNPLLRPFACRVFKGSEGEDEEEVLIARSGKLKYQLIWQCPAGS